MAKTRQAIPVTKPTILLPADENGPAKRLDVDALVAAVDQIWDMGLLDHQKALLRACTSRSPVPEKRPLKLTLEMMQKAHACLPDPWDHRLNGSKEFRMRFRRAEEPVDFALNMSLILTEREVMLHEDELFFELVETQRAVRDRNTGLVKHVRESLYWRLRTPVEIVAKEYQ